MKLEWRCSEPDKERWFANVAEGQIIIDLVIGNEWRTSFLSWLHGPLPFSMCGVRYVTIHEAKAAVQDWYNSIAAQGEKERGE